MTDSATTTRTQAPCEVVAHSTPVYRATRVGLWLYMKLRHGMRVEGLENLPKSGGAVLVLNHQSFLDIPLVAAATSRHVSFVARKSLEESKALSYVMRESGVVLIQRGEVADRGALREMQAHLAAGDLLAMFPEGTRTHDGSVGEFKAGALLAARKAGVPLIPAGIRGSFQVWPRSQKRPGSGRMALRFCPPVQVDEPQALERVRSAIVAAVGDGSFEGVEPS